MTSAFDKRLAASNRRFGAAFAEPVICLLRARARGGLSVAVQAGETPVATSGEFFTDDHKLGRAQNRDGDDAQVTQYFGHEIYVILDATDFDRQQLRRPRRDDRIRRADQIFAIVTSEDLSGKRLLCALKLVK
ncbi:hypothetical protein [Polycladidibacter hongkongensis]|uniref:hypothetical protein n=1 Tax=Polycladidibacter hongkongensis TaxID=1647556 RepID=UPI00083374A2|nr:hypothetical protein [Pseudovibrio hongkongensis]